jgi:recombination protein RecR
MLLPEPVQRIIDAFSALPGIGPKTASRLTFFLLRAPDSLGMELAAALEALKASTSQCPVCHNIMASGRETCEICSDPERDGRVVCVVEEPLDVFALERAGGFRGCYHVLHGVLSPIEGIGADELKIKELVERVRAGGVEEVIMATNPSMEGEATAMYIHRGLVAFDVRVTRLARGLPVGGDLEYTDPNTLRRAIDGRQAMDG